LLGAPRWRRGKGSTENRGSVCRGRARARAWRQPPPQPPPTRRRAGRTHQAGRMRTSDVPVLSAAGLIVALSAPLGCAAYISAVDVGPVEWVCETTCLDIVGPWAEGGGATQPESKIVRASPEFQASGVECTGCTGLVAGQQECSNAHVVGANPRDCCCSPENRCRMKGKVKKSIAIKDEGGAGLGARCFSS
jgi:hypothetical protein